ncbi:MAG: multicomponent Na+:H+ antiporter subunit G [Paracoccaceae bacterium]|jgi:multicomponent Na+:H+ antiporter subunit G
MIVDTLALLGSICFLIASIGLLRMPDSFARIHAATKASSLGIIFLVIAAVIQFPTPGAIFISVMTVILVFLTAPMACQAIATRLLPKSDSHD